MARGQKTREEVKRRRERKKERRAGLGNDSVLREDFGVLFLNVVCSCRLNSVFFSTTPSLHALLANVFAFFLFPRFRMADEGEYEQATPERKLEIAKYFVQSTPINEVKFVMDGTLLALSRPGAHSSFREKLVRLRRECW